MKILKFLITYNISSVAIPIQCLIGMDAYNAYCIPSDLRRAVVTPGETKLHLENLT